MTVVISSPGCIPCRFTKARLEKNGIEFEERNVAEDPDALELARSLGYQSTPVVIAPDGSHWSGLDPDRIDAIAA